MRTLTTAKASQQLDLDVQGFTSMKGIVIAAGLGSRMGAFTEAFPTKSKSKIPNKVLYKIQYVC